MCIAYDNRYFALKKVVIGRYDASTFANPTFAHNSPPGRCHPKTSRKHHKKRFLTPPLACGPGHLYRGDISSFCGDARGSAGNIPAKRIFFYIKVLRVFMPLYKANLAGDFPAAVKC